MPLASTPTRLRAPRSETAAIPISPTSSCVSSFVTGVWRASGYLAAIRTSARPAPWRSTMRRATCSAGPSTSDAASRTTASIAPSQTPGGRRALQPARLDRLLEELGEAGHVHALLARVEVDGAVDRRGHELLAVPVADPDRLLDPAHTGAGQGEPHLRLGRLEIDVARISLPDLAHECPLRRCPPTSGGR